MTDRDESRILRRLDSIDRSVSGRLDKLLARRKELADAVSVPIEPEKTPVE